MSEISTDKGTKKKGQPKKLSTRVDFTPMVDLAFLLITFFILSTSMMKPETMEISMPSKDKVKEEEQTKVKASNAITIMLGKNDKVYYYFGTPDTAKVKITTFAPKGGIRDILLKRNMDVAKQIFELKAKKANKQITQDQFTAESAKIRDNKAAPTVMIKATDESNYNNLVNILDEMNICSIAKYAIVPIEGRDKEMIKKKDPDSGLK